MAWQPRAGVGAALPTGLPGKAGTGAAEPRWQNRPSRNQDFKRSLRLLALTRRPISTSTWLPDGSAQRKHRRPVYVSFVSKAILWDRGLCTYTAHVHPNGHSSLCPRFLSHMKARPEDFRPPCFFSSTLRPQPPSQGKAQETHVLVAPKTQTLEGCFHFTPERRKCAAHNAGFKGGRPAAVVVPCLPLPAMPQPSTTDPTRPQQRALHTESRRQLSGSNTAPPSPPGPQLAAEVKDEFPEKERAPQPAVVSITESTELHWKLNLGPAGPKHSVSPDSRMSQDSLSDLSRPPSSLFSRSTDLSSGRSSVLSADVSDLDPGRSASVSPLHSSTVMDLPLSTSPVESETHRSATSITSPPPNDLDLCQSKPFSPRPTSSVCSHSDKPVSSNKSIEAAQSLHQSASIDRGPKPSLDSDCGLVTLTFPSTTWSSCPSPQRTTPRSASGAKLTPSPSVSRLESQRWPVLPPISPVRGLTAATRYSELSCSRSHIFDELEAIAPPSTSSLSLDEASDSSGTFSPDTDLSSGLAALTVGCDSGNLGSLSRVQLLLLDRLVPETLQSSCSFDGDYGDPNWSPAGDLRPLTAGSMSEGCDFAGKVQENKSDPSERGSWSQSSWIINMTPSNNTFRSSCSPCPSSNSSYKDGGGQTDDESIDPEWRDDAESAGEQSRPQRNEDHDRRIEERKKQVMHMLSKLQDETPRKRNGNRGRSNFEDFDFLSKYCIFSQEKLAEYQRAFEAEDSDADGYISCLQVLLALKNIIPPELLTDEEEIYVYRILEMVDFRVTDGLVDLRLFAVIASLAQKIATMDEFMRSLISNMDFRSLEVRLFKAKQLFLFLLEDQHGEAQQGFISAEQLLLELKAGGIQLDQEAAVRLELQNIPPLDLLDFLAYLPLFMLIHKSVISNPLNDSGIL